MRKTKILCTLGPATDDENVLRELFLNGMNVARLNFSHGDHPSHKERVKAFKKLRDEFKNPIGLLLDTKGPEIRVKKFKNGKITLKAGQLFTLTSKDLEGSDKIVTITYDKLYKDVDVDTRILIDDGLIEMSVIKIDDKDIVCKVIDGGEVSDNKSINVPGVKIKMPYISERDRLDIMFGIANDFDFIAASFVRNGQDLKDLRDILEKNGGETIKIIAKIENREGVDNIDEIIRLADGIMIARGDMGVEIPFEELPALQKSIIKKCNFAGKPVITATQMLDSMIRNPRPTRAELTDVANAIYDGTSALMLSGETSVGKYPVQALTTMTKIAVNAEQHIDYKNRFEKQLHTISSNVTNAISHATVTAAHNLGAKAIISVSKSGHTARMVSKYRPACQIAATTISEKVYNQLAISWGVVPIFTEFRETTDEIFEQAISRSVSAGLVSEGDLVILTGGMPANIIGTTNTVKVHIIGDVLLKGKGLNEKKVVGTLYIADSRNSLTDFHNGDILVVKKSSDKLLPIIRNASAVITEEKESDSQVALVGKALDIPVITEAENATDILKSGLKVTIDSSCGYVFNGIKK